MVLLICRRTNTRLSGFCQPVVQKFFNDLQFDLYQKAMRLIGTRLEEFVPHLCGSCGVEVPPLALAIFPAQIQRADPMPFFALKDRNPRLFRASPSG
jgi:hypothetical protein